MHRLLVIALLYLLEALHTTDNLCNTNVEMLSVNTHNWRCLELL